MNAPALVAADGTPLRRPSAMWRSPAFRGADRVSKEMLSWTPILSPLDAELPTVRNELAARARDLSRNNGWAAGLKQHGIDTIVGAGWKRQSLPNYRVLGQTFKWQYEFGRLSQAFWQLHADDQGRYIDAARRCNFRGLLGQAFLSWWHTGEIAAQMMWLPGRGGRYATAVQMIAPARISNPHGQPDTPFLRDGVELDAHGAPVAYWVRKRHPGDVLSEGQFEWVRVPRETSWGRPLFIHAFEVEEDGQSRGFTPLTSLIEALRLHEIYERAEASAALLNAVFAAVLRTQPGYDAEALAEIMGAEPDEGGNQVLRLNDGTIVPKLPTGFDLDFKQSNRPSSAFAEFERQVLRRAAAGSGRSYEEIARDYSQTNYSSHRAAMLQTWRYVTGKQCFIGESFADLVHGCVLEEMIDAGDVELPPGAPDFQDARGAYCAGYWIGPGRGQVDELKETQAAAARPRHFLSTRTTEAATQGEDFEDIVDGLAREKALIEERGLVEGDVTPTMSLVPRTDMPGENDVPGEK